MKNVLVEAVNLLSLDETITRGLSSFLDVLFETN